MDTAIRFPDFIIGGAPKCGTSSLYFWLADHPQLCASKVKETNYFADKVGTSNAERNFINNGVDDYSHFFKHCNNQVKAYEASSHYLYDENALNHLTALPTNPKFIFILRDPKAQIHSHYRMLKYRVKRFNGDLNEYLERPNVTYQAEYVTFLKKWYNKIGADRVKVMIFEDLMKNKESNLLSVCDFLGVDKSFYKNFDFQHRNETVAIKSGWLHKTGLKLQPLIPTSVQKALVPLYLKMNSNALPKKTDEEQKALEKLNPFAERIKKEVNAFLPDLDVSSWNKK